MSFRTFLTAASLAVSFAACAPDSSVETLEDSSTDERAVSGDVVYVVTGRDFRKCSYPMCSGFFVKAVNKAKTTCFDGSKQTECYVSAIDTTGLGLSGTDADELRAAVESGQVLLSAELTELDEPEGVPAGFAKLQVHKAYQAETGNEVTGSYYVVEPSGITCITTPCASLDARKINSTSVKPVTNIDFSALGLTEGEQQAFLSTIFEQNLVVSGSLSTVNTPAGREKRLTLSEIFSTVQHTSQDSCVDACGGQSPDGCYCDDLCVEYGDCCADHADACQ